VVPSLLLFLASHPAVTKEHLSPIEKVVCGAAPATKNLIDKFKAKIDRDIDFRQGQQMLLKGGKKIKDLHITSHYGDLRDSTLF
jgi:hypothetical protein